uniref:Uncharacterized protein n=1 Tax=mine drainage metagenome TaxID=410659 RepID=E6QVP3_9ZZZZ
MLNKYVSLRCIGVCVAHLSRWYVFLLQIALYSCEFVGEQTSVSPRSVVATIRECGIALCEESAALVVSDILIGNWDRGSNVKVCFGTSHTC